MLVSTLLRAIGDGPLTARGTMQHDPDLNEVLLDDGVTSLGPGQIVLAIRPGVEQDLVDRAAEAGCPAVVLGADTPVDAVDPPENVVVLECGVGWTQLFVLLRTMLLASHGEANDDTGPSSVHGLADAVAVMVGGSVVLYDRAHRVVAYSVQGHPIDQVRRDAILGRRTPDQWVRRFTVDRTAYETYSDPGAVVRVGNYEEMRTRLRIAVHTGGDVIGEISVGEGDTPFGPHAEEALQRAARLAVPAMLRHRRAQDVEQTARTRTVMQLLRDGSAPTGAFGESGEGLKLFLLGFSLDTTAEQRTDPGDELASERFGHFLSLHLAAVEPLSVVAQFDGVFWALVPAGRATVDRLTASADAALGQLERMGVQGRAALSETAVGPPEAPTTKRTIDNLLAVARAGGGNRRVMTPTTSWAELVMVGACRGGTESSKDARSPIADLLEHDERNDSDLVATLAIFLDEFGSVSSAAARLFLHTNTLRHRLQRISEVSGIDLTDSTQRLAAAILLRSDALVAGRAELDI